MRPHHRSKRRRPDSPQARAAQSAIWLIGLGVLFLTGWWWPGILIVIGLSMVAGALLQADAPAATERSPEAEAPIIPPSLTTPPTPFVSSAPERVVLQAESLETTRPVRLPDICPYCGAPPRTLPARDPANPYACPYCGANLQALGD